jgi:predicted lactoylglutathione lyase
MTTPAPRMERGAVMDQSVAMALPQRINSVTLGARSVRSLRDFYRAWGWSENDESNDEYTSFTAGDLRLALYPLDLLRHEAAPGSRPPEPGTWNGVTLAINFASSTEVDQAVEDARAAGASLVGAPADRDWGGYSGYVADPEGNRWELVWAPFFDPT